jgi:hypothetical protein
LDPHAYRALHAFYPRLGNLFYFAYERSHASRSRLYRFIYTLNGIFCLG